MTQNEDTVAPAQAPPVGTRIELDGRVWTVAEPDDEWQAWYLRSRSFPAVYLMDPDSDGDWIVEGTAYVELYGVVQP